MIQGVVTAQLDAVVPLQVGNDAGTKVMVNAVTDTGFDDYLTLPPTRSGG